MRIIIEDDKPSAAPMVMAPPAQSGGEPAAHVHQRVAARMAAATPPPRSPVRAAPAAMPRLVPIDIGPAPDWLIRRAAAKPAPKSKRGNSH